MRPDTEEIIDHSHEDPSQPGFVMPIYLCPCPPAPPMAHTSETSHSSFTASIPPLPITGDNDATPPAPPAPTPRPRLAPSPARHFAARAVATFARAPWKKAGECLNSAARGGACDTCRALPYNYHPVNKYRIRPICRLCGNEVWSTKSFRAEWFRRWNTARKLLWKLEPVL